MWTVVLSLLVSASPCAVDKDGYCVDKIVRATITYAEAKGSLKINCALGDVVSLTFPPNVERRGEPGIGASSWGMPQSWSEEGSGPIPT